MADGILSYAAIGWHVFPLKARDKVPMFGTHGFKDASIDTETIENWSKTYPDSNWGIATGASGLVVLDVDHKSGGWDSLKELHARHNLDLDTVAADTGGGGKHFYYAAPADVEIRLSAGQLAKGLDIRANGGYVVAPPSTHQNGKPYRWCLGQAPLDVPVKPFPAVLIKLLAKREAPAIVGTPDGSIVESVRNNTLTSFAGSMRRRGMTQASILAALRAENAERCRPPLSEVDVARIAASVSRYQPEDVPLVTIDVNGSEAPATNPSGIFTVMDLDADILRLYEEGSDRGLDTGWMVLDQYYRVAAGQWTLVTGIPSHGKSAWVDALLVNLAKMYDWRFALCSPENQPLARHFAKLARCYVGKPFDKGFTQRMTLDELVGAQGWIDEHFVWVLPEDRGMTVAGVLEAMSVAHQARRINGLVIDPWNELDHTRPNTMSETEFISASLTAIRRFARREQLHIWLVAHPTKMPRPETGKQYAVPRPYDVSGSANWFNKADNAISVYRHEEERQGVEIHVQKVRFDSNGGRGVARLMYDKPTGRYMTV